MEKLHTLSLVFGRIKRNDLKRTIAHGDIGHDQRLDLKVNMNMVHTRIQGTYN